MADDKDVAEIQAQLRSSKLAKRLAIAGCLCLTFPILAMAIVAVLAVFASLFSC